MDPAAVIATYGAAWNEADDAKRAELLDASWSDDGVYTDPTATASGRVALAAHIGGFLALVPGHRIDQATGVDVYGDLFRFGWTMYNGDTEAMTGMDFGEFGPDGRIRRIVGFFGPFPALDG